MRREMLEALKASALGNIKRAKMNVEVYLTSPVGIGEHPDIMSAVEEQIDLISKEEENALFIAILLHDIGHGPFSHAIENSLIENVSHEFISLYFMQFLNKRFKGQLDLAIKIFKGVYERPFFHQLISGQLDMDRLDYLKRDSFYTGVSEGSINSERLISMLNVVEDKLVVEEKGIYSVEKFIIARRLMYWQVYLHKTSLVAEQLLTRLLKRAKYLVTNGVVVKASKHLNFFLN